MKGGYRRYSIWATVNALRAMDPPESFKATEILDFIAKQSPTIRPWRRDMELRTVKTFLMRGHRAGFLKATKSEYLKPTRYRVWEYSFRSVEDMIIRAKIRPRYLDEIVEGKKTMEFRQIEDFILTDGRRTVHTAVLNIENAGALKREIMAKYPSIPWDPERPIFLFDIRPLVYWNGKEHIDIANNTTIKPWEVERIIKESGSNGNKE